MQTEGDLAAHPATSSKPASPADFPVPAAEAPLRIAVLDDEPDIVASVTQVLRLVGLDSHAFTCSLTLEATLEGATYDAFVVDWSLGQETSLALIVRLRADSRYRQTPIFLVSGHLGTAGTASDEAIRAAIAEHRLEYRAKPYSSVRLAQEVRRAVAGAA